MKSPNFNLKASPSQPRSFARTSENMEPSDALPVANAKTIAACRELHMGSTALRELIGFELFVNVEVLWVNNNQLTELTGLDTLVRLRCLYAHNNQLRSIADSSLPAFKFLRELHLSNNKIMSLERTVDVLKHFKFLELLELHGNPCAEEPNYRLFVIHAIPSLHVFDRHVVSAAEREAAQKKFGRRRGSPGTAKPRGPPKATPLGVTPLQRSLARDAAAAKRKLAAADAAHRDAMFSGLQRMSIDPSTVPPGGAMTVTRPVTGLLDTVRATEAAGGGGSAPAAGLLGEWELYKLRKIYVGMDTDKSGTLSKAELAAGLAQAEDLGFKVAPGASLDAIFEALDADGNDSISWKEFLKGALGELELETAGGEAVDPLTFVPLGAEEAMARAKGYAKQAAKLQNSLLRMADGDPRMAAVRKQCVDLATRASLLEDLGNCQAGKFAPAAPPPPRVAARSDVIDIIAVVPRKQAMKVAGKATSDARVPPVGEESDSDTDDEDSKLFGAELEEYRKRRKARKPHAVLTSTLQLPGSRKLR